MPTISISLLLTSSLHDFFVSSRDFWTFLDSSDNCSLRSIENYEQFKQALDTELANQAAGFVRTGYLLKKARDTDILASSGYSTVAEFAKAEYGLSKDIVSRYIAINDRYSEGGYSDRLQDKYEGYGVAKLQDMLTLPIEVVDLISPEMTRKEIAEVKAEVKEEEAISPVEVS